MTKERRLAIEMWEYIKQEFARDPQYDVDIGGLKIAFCNKHGLIWESYCWFCQYIPTCYKCPLHRCDEDSPYAKAISYRLPLEVRLAACDDIINALKGAKPKGDWVVRTEEPL